MLSTFSDNKVYKGVVVAPHVPRTEGGHYWGYSVRLASCLSKPPTLTALSARQILIPVGWKDAEKLITSTVHLQFICCFTVTAGAVFSESPYKDGYDVTVGTSERGSSIDQMTLSPFK